MGGDLAAGIFVREKIPNSVAHRLPGAGKGVGAATGRRGGPRLAAAGGARIGTDGATASCRRIVTPITRSTANSSKEVTSTP